MTRILTLCAAGAAAFAVAACSAHEPLERAPTTVTMGVPVGDDGTGIVDVRLTRDDVVPALEIPGTRAALWPLIAGVYGEVGLAEPVLDRASWTAVLQNHTATRRLGRETMSTFFECGAGVTGPHANTRRIRMTVQTALESTATGETVARTRVDAVAVSTEGASGVPIQCSSKGILERRINNMLLVRAAGGGG
jgi:hypothetical protein